MTKLRNLFRLHLTNRFRIVFYYLKRIVKGHVSTELEGLNDYFHTLIRIDAVQDSESKTSYISKFRKNSKQFKIRKRPSSDIDVLNQVFYHNEYEAVANAYKNAFQSASVNIIDAGANIGLTSLYFSTAFKNMNLISIEPEPQNFKLLEYNLKNNNVSAQLLKAGLWSKTTFLKIIRDFRDQKDWSFRVEETNNTEGVYAVTINKLIRDNNWTAIDILKIDIEGSEKEVFTSKQANVDFLNKTKCIAMEIHDEFDCREHIYSVLENYGFEFFNSGELTIGINKKMSA